MPLVPPPTTSTCVEQLRDAGKAVAAKSSKPAEADRMRWSADMLGLLCEYYEKKNYIQLSNTWARDSMHEPSKPALSASSESVMRVSLFTRLSECLRMAERTGCSR